MKKERENSIIRMTDSISKHNDRQVPQKQRSFPEEENAD
jgi:hypothetical protein